MTHYCVPVENLAYAPDHALRWFVASYHAITAADAARSAWEDFANFNAMVTIWAATTHEPSFEELRALRASYDLSTQRRARKRA